MPKPEVKIYVSEHAIDRARQRFGVKGDRPTVRGLITQLAWQALADGIGHVSPNDGKRWLMVEFPGRGLGVLVFANGANLTVCTVLTQSQALHDLTNPKPVRLRVV
jgi:hypothetical protein